MSAAHENQRNTNFVKHPDNPALVHTLYPGPLWIPVVLWVLSESQEFIFVFKIQYSISYSYDFISWTSDAWTGDLRYDSVVSR